MIDNECFHVALIINCIMSDHLTDEEVSKIFFKEHFVNPNGDVVFQYRESERQITRVKVRGGWSMLKPTSSGKQNVLQLKTVSECSTLSQEE
jgi:hypothetical protein